MFRKIILLLVLSLSFSSAVQAQLAVRDGHVEAQLVSETTSIKPGDPFWVALKLVMDPGWHTYWINSGDSGLATKIQWHLPAGIDASPIQWPYPQKIDQPPLTSYGYSDQVFLLIKMMPSDQLALGETTLKARVDWLMCQVGCIPGKADLEIKIPVSSQTPQINTNVSKDFIITRSHLPLTQSGWTVRATTQNHNLIFDLKNTGPSYDLSDVYFFAERDDLVNHADPQILTKTPEGYSLQVNRSSISSAPLTHIKGILVSKEGWRGSSSEQALSVNLPIGATSSSSNSADTLNVSLALLFAFIGGLILNLMPCVLPVISLKILGFIKQAGEDPHKIRLHGLAFTAGVVISFWLLAGLLILLQSAGQQIGWGFQFQSPAFVIFLIILFSLLALNLLGLFEINLPFAISLPRSTSELNGAFFNGVLATITATPCTAPFMGTALGFALTQSAWISLWVFTFLGLGMAFPYLVLSMFPSLLRFLPKPGPWMIHFKRFLGILLIATVIWLLWILSIQVGVLKESTTPKASVSGIYWQKYSPELVDELRANGRIVFIDFSARWCLTCQANKKIALEQTEVVAKFKEMNVATIKADWTLQDPNITKALASYGKNSIPLYVLYGKNATDAVILPELLTPKTVLEALDKIQS